MKLGKASLLSLSIIAMTCGVAESICAAEASLADKPAQIFRDASPMLGKEISIQGILRWTFENRNLFPPGTDPNRPLQGYCLPVLIKRTDGALQKIAESFDRSAVIIRGRIIDPTPPGQGSVGSCKPIGIDVESIKKAE